MCGVKFAILLFGRDPKSEPRVLSEISELGANNDVGIITDRCDNIPIEIPNKVIRVLLYFLGLIHPKLRLFFSMLFYERTISLSEYVDKHVRVIAHGFEEASFCIAKGVNFIFHSEEYYPRQFDASLKFRILEMRYRKYVIKKIFSHTNCTIVESDAVALQYSRDFMQPVENFLVLPNQPRHAPKLNVQLLTTAQVRLVHHGLINKMRGIEYLLEINNKLGKNYSLTLMGPTSPEYTQKLREYVYFDTSVRFKKSVAYEQIVPELNTFDLGLIIFGSRHFQHNYMTVPNKFWECIQARVPVIVHKSSAMSEIVRDLGVGFVVDGDVHQVVREILQIPVEDINKAKVECHRQSFYLSQNSWCGKYGADIVGRLQREKL